MQNSPSRHSSLRILIPILALAVIALIAVLLFASKRPGQEEPIPPQESASTSEEPRPRTTPEGSSPGERLRIVIREGGLYGIDGDELRSLGIDPERAGELRLTHRGQPIPFQWIGQGEDRRLVFYGRPSDSIYSPENVYWLERGEAESPSPLVAMGASPEGEARDTAWARQRFEEQKLYLSTLPEDQDHWLWQPLYGRRGVTITFSLDEPAPGEATVRVSLWSHTSTPEDPDHHVIVAINDVPAADVTWDGQGQQIISGTLPSGALRPGENRMTILAPGDTGAPIEVSYLDWVEVVYPRPLLASEGRLDFWAEPGAYQVRGLPDGDVALWDITDPDHPLPLSGFVTDREGDEWIVRFARPDAEGLRRYWIAAGEGLLSPWDVSARPLAHLPRPEDGADYIAIVHPDLEEAVQPLLDYRSEQGLRVFAVSPDALYDAYTFGIKDPAAIRSFLADALRSWPEPRPRFVLLVGDASYDPYGYLQGPERDLIPTALVQTYYVGQTASDNWLADVDEDGRPDIALGRLPAQTPQQVQAMVQKVLRFEQAGGEEWPRRALMVADDKEPYFFSFSDALIKEYLAAVFEVERVYLGQVDDPHARLLEAMNRGVGLINYIGHGSITVWAKEKVLSTDDVAKLRNKDRPPVLVNMTCLTGYFHHPQMVSLAETLLRSPDGGVATALVPTSESLSTDQEALAEAFYRAFVDPEVRTIGEAMVRAKREVPLERDGQRDVIATFNLLGDPALRLQHPIEP
ncbi:MAG: hypothetical protein GXP39_00505 [Chloroflexi bacterium]|nr:hypothetical protein [Chloroflexota bacterium]